MDYLLKKFKRERLLSFVYQVVCSFVFGFCLFKLILLEQYLVALFIILIFIIKFIFYIKEQNQYNRFILFLILCKYNPIIFFPIDNEIVKGFTKFYGKKN